ncbi:MAG: pyruvate, phosphate dikinase, partial [Mangrovimonas sp.]|nr:pyruvate, phosphate dikinase [Mangrovimonas sp.]
EKIMDAKFGDVNNPLLLSVRSGARVSMPGMMDTVLNLGLNDEVVQGLANKTKNERFAWDSYRRFVQMYGSVVMGMKPENKDDLDPFEELIDNLKEKREIEQDTEFTVQDLKDLVFDFKKAIYRRLGKEFPTDPWDQLWLAIMAVFDSWNGKRAVYYRNMHGYPADWGTAVNVQAMVFGNMGNNS